MLGGVLELPDHAAVPRQLHDDPALEDEGRRIPGGLVHDHEEVAVLQEVDEPDGVFPAGLHDVPTVDRPPFHIDQVGARAKRGCEERQTIERLAGVPAREAGPDPALLLLLDRSDDGGGAVLGGRDGSTSDFSLAILAGRECQSRRSNGDAARSLKKPPSR